MGKTTIEWADFTFNPWVGCTKVGPPCDNCYAEGWARRTGQHQLWNGERRRTTAQNWQLPIKWNAKAKAEGIRYRVFCASLADVFDNQVPQRWRDDLWHRIEQTPHLDWLLLTKRAGNIRKMLPDTKTGVRPWGDGWSNVWLGITCGDQSEFDRDWPKLREIEAVVRFISYEPALGPLLLDIASHPDWVIAGGESGGKARTPQADWFRDIRDDCDRVGAAFLFKQWGEWASGVGGAMFRSGKKAAGRSLDGREWNEYPTPRISVGHTDLAQRELLL
jgi:protein gp37